MALVVRASKGLRNRGIFSDWKCPLYVTGPERCVCAPEFADGDGPCSFSFTCSGLDEGLIRFVVLHAESALPASLFSLLVPDLLAPSHSCFVLGLMLHRLVHSV